MRERITPRELYQDPKIRDRYRRFGGLALNLILESTFEVLEPLATKENAIEFFEELKASENNFTQARAAEVLANFPPEVILENYGLEALMWAGAKTANLSIGRGYVLLALEEQGIDTNLFLRAKDYSRGTKGEGLFRDFIEYYFFTEKVAKHDLQGVDISSILKNTAKPGIEIRDKRALDCSLIPLSVSGLEYEGYAEGWSSMIEGNLRYDIYMDAPFGFALTYKNKPAAVVSYVTEDDRQIFIEQIQGVRPGKLKKDNNGYMRLCGLASSRGLAPLDWRMTCLEVVFKIAKDCGASKITIKSGKNNAWLVGNDEGSFNQERAIRVYDDLAQRAGFVTTKGGNWMSELE